MKRSTVATPTSEALVRVMLLAALSALLGAHAAAQTNGARPDRGATPGASYSVSGFDSVSLTNGNVGLSVPLASLPPLPGGKLGLTLNAVYNSKLWDVRRVERRVTGVSGFDTYVEDTPELSDLVKDLGGWRVTGRYRVVLRDASESYSYQIPPNQSMTTPDDWAALQYRWVKAVLVTPDGAEHELRPVDSNNYYGHFITGGRDYLRNYYRDTPDTTGSAMRYYSFDGSYISAVIYPQTSSRRWALFMPDGTQVVEEADATQRITDTSGNSIKIFWDASGVEHYQDERNPDREIKITSDPAANGGLGQTQVSYKTVGGDWASVVLNFGTTRVRGQLYKTGAQGASGVTCQVDKVLDKSFSVLREIVFPATETGVAARRFSFGYNSDSDSTEPFTTLMTAGCGMAPQSYATTSSRGLGALNHVVTPTGATIDYTYSLSSTHHYLGVDTIAEEMITSKKVTHDGTFDTWDYDVSPGQSHGTVHNPDGTFATETSYQHDPVRGVFATQTGELAGLVYRSASANVMVERRWALTPFAGANTGPAGSSSSNRVNFNPVVTEEYTTLTDDQGNALKMSAKKYLRDYNGNVTEVKEYDWFDPIPASGRDALGIPNGVPGGLTPLRTTTTSYHNSPAADTSADVYAKRNLTVGTPSVINAAKETTIGPGVTRYSYDGQAYGGAPTKGNLTEVSSFDDLGDTEAWNDRWVSTKFTYDPTYGNLEKGEDANGNVTRFYYEDETHALPTKIEVDPLNGTGLQTTLTAYDKWTGLVTSTTDRNGQTTAVDYANALLNAPDPFGRPGVITSPAVTADGVTQHRKVFNTYEDGLRRVTVESDLRAEGDRLLKGRTTSDELGRPVLSEQSEDGASYTVSSVSVYEQGGRVTYTSNPRRVGGEVATDGWTRVTRDAAGRLNEVATFAGLTKPGAADSCNAAAGCTGRATTDYYAEFTTVTDQAGRVRRSRSDALRRLVRVDEPSGEPTAQDNMLGGYDSPTQPTAYSYDALGNLTGIRQGGQLQNGQYVGGQTRTFTYGSVSHISSATNPESGKVSYEYDKAGNLKKKTDARGVVTTYTYDGLNRVTLTDYSDQTPDVTYAYEAAGVANSKGRLTRFSSSVSAYSFTGYDALGRVTGSSQEMPNPDGTATTYPMSDYRYDLAGNLISEKYPSGRVVKTEYDKAGRVAGVKNQATGLYYAGGDPTIPDNQEVIKYAAHGPAAVMKLGNGLWDRTEFNSRLQIRQIGLGTAQSNANVLQLDYAYGGTDNNGNIKTQTITAPGAAQPYVQTYGYDELNRLKSAEESAGSTQWKQVYSYDRYGNRTLTTGTTYPAQLDATNNPAVSGVNNQVSSAGYVYDEAGNLRCDALRPCATGGTNPAHFDYDAENRMARAGTGGAGAPSGGANYSYDAAGKRVKKVVGGVTTVFVYDAAGVLVAEYGGEQPTAGGTSYPTTDTLGSTRVVTGQDQGVKVRYDYLPFGEEVPSSLGGRSAVPGYGAAAGVRKRFGTYERDAELLDLDFAQARYYNFRHGRYYSADPLMASADIVNPQSFNRYVYVGNNPVNISDPTGEVWGELNGAVQWFGTAAQMAALGFHPYTSLIARISGTNQLVVLNPNAGQVARISDSLQAVRQLVAWGVEAGVVAEFAVEFAVPAAAVGVAIAGYYAAEDSLDGRPEAVRDFKMAKWQEKYIDRVLSKMNEANAESGQSSANTEGESSPANPDPEKNQPTTPSRTPGGRNLTGHAEESLSRHGFKKPFDQVDDVIDNASRTTTQADGGQVYIQRTGGRQRAYNVVVTNQRGDIVTGMRNLSPRELRNLGDNYGFDPNP